ncbi:MAG: hypothetical protein ABI416_07930 [Ginsengibacter sp.]
MSYLNSRLKYYFHKMYARWNYDTQKGLISLGKLHANANKNKTLASLAEAEFQVFSQRGEDGIIQYIIDKIDIPNKIFVEFGVENYVESNTRFLLINNNWAGLVIDGSKENVRFIKNDFIYWKYDITAIDSFVTKDTINKLISGYTSCNDIGLLSIDLDGVDYWIWEAINVISPRIVICEYNSMFGPEKKVTVPYSDDFTRRKAHYSDLYFGASLPAFVELAERKGYNFIGTASTGVNAFFVRKDVAAPFDKIEAVAAFTESANRDSRDTKGNLSFLRHNERLVTVKDLAVYDLDLCKSILVKELYKL